jgi:hypothetical protein
MHNLCAHSVLETVCSKHTQQSSLLFRNEIQLNLIIFSAIRYIHLSIFEKVGILFISGFPLMVYLLINSAK